MHRIPILRVAFRLTRLAYSAHGEFPGAFFSACGPGEEETKHTYYNHQGLLMTGGVQYAREHAWPKPTQTFKRLPGHLKKTF